MYTAQSVTSTICLGSVDLAKVYRVEVALGCYHAPMMLLFVVVVFFGGGGDLASIEIFGGAVPPK